MAKRDTEVLDDQGNTIQPPSPESPVALAVWLLEYARKRRFAIPKIVIGDVTIFATDLDQLAGTGDRATVADLDDESDMAQVLRMQQGG